MTENSPSPEALAFAHDVEWPDSRIELARLCDEFARQAVEREREEKEWLRRLLRWSRARFKHDSYVAWLDKYLAAGPSPAPADEPQLTRSMT